MKNCSLRSKRLILEPFSERDITTRYIGWLNDPDVVRYSLHRHVSHDKKNCMAFLQQIRSAGSIFLTILLKMENGERHHVGNIVANMDANNQTADMTILLGERDVWGMGIGTEAWITLMNFLFINGDIRKVTAGAVEQNNAMLSIMKRAGMHEEARRRRQYIVDGQEVDLIYFARFASQIG